MKTPFYTLYILNDHKNVSQWIMIKLIIKQCIPVVLDNYNK